MTFEFSLPTVVPDHYFQTKVDDKNEIKDKNEDEDEYLDNLYNESIESIDPKRSQSKNKQTKSKKKPVKITKGAKRKRSLESNHPQTKNKKPKPKNKPQKPKKKPVKITKGAKRKRRVLYRDLKERHKYFKSKHKEITSIQSKIRKNLQNIIKCNNKMKSFMKNKSNQKNDLMIPKSVMNELNKECVEMKINVDTMMNENKIALSKIRTIYKESYEERHEINNVLEELLYSGRHYFRYCPNIDEQGNENLVLNP